jgi:7-carboxy-7-deazaguanine synthase
MQIDEIFYSLQGEGTRRGRPCAFVRLTGCNLRCVWCDTPYAFHGGRAMPVEDVVAAVSEHPTRLVCVTGGEPLLQPQVHALMDALLARGYTVLLETSGSVDAGGVDPRVVRILDLKAPGSGEVDHNLWSNVDDLRDSDEVKIVIADREDYVWARDRVLELDLPARCRAVLFSPVHGTQDPTELAGWILTDGLPVTLQQQEHKRLWPGVERGV